MSTLNLKEAWLSLPSDAQEAVVKQSFMPALMNALGFASGEWYPEFTTGRSSDTVDYAARHNHADSEDVFLHTQKNPLLLVEVKGRDVNLREGRGYVQTVAQIKRYLHSSAKSTVTAKWGIITNGDHIQLFRRHGKVIYPYTKNIHLTEDNISAKVELLKNYINKQENALSIAVYNNKGGVGKTTTIMNLAGVLSLPPFNKKVLVVDFDPNQRDLTKLLKAKIGDTHFFDCLKDYKTKKLKDAVHKYRLKTKKGVEFGFDIIPADKKFLETDANQLISVIQRGRLRTSLEELKSHYDYIFIDVPPNWLFFSQEAIIACDVVLMPSRHNDLSALENAALAIQDFFPEIGKERRAFLEELNDPIPLPTFFNGGPSKIPDAQKEQLEKTVESMLGKLPKKQEPRLRRFFFPKYTRRTKDTSIFAIPSYAHIANAAFSRRPAVYSSQVARANYKKLIKEYFI